MRLKSKVYILKNTQDRAHLARELLNSGARVLLLQGNLGAGKTTFVRTLAEILGWKQAVTSPTFNLLRVYPVTTVRWRKNYDMLVHIDMYRLPHGDSSLPIDEYLTNTRALVAVEWPQHSWSIPGTVHLDITVRPDLTRKVKVSWLCAPVVQPSDF